jgi:23S rRNA (cytidine1920-2'-O)/16S rRNA (cytidine1409-2'-O)-methyltransferase
VERGLFESRARAQAAIAAGLVTADDVAVAKPSDEIRSDAALRATPAHPWVSRGGVKLAAALDHLGGDPRFDPADRVCLDVGTSTGGFAEVLLARGARLVVAVDVGHGQLHPRLRGHPRMVSLEGTDIRTLDPGRLAERPDLVTFDTSFISLELVLPAALALTRPPASLLALVKPQFEAGPNAVKKGIVRDPRIHRAVSERIAAVIAALGWTVTGVVPSPIAGGDGNRELFIAAHRA